MADKKPRIIKMADGSPYNAMLIKDGVSYKAKSHKGVEIVYQEINLAEYDERIEKLAQIIGKQPDVDVLGIIKDALCDLPLDYLAKVERELTAELAKPKPKIVTKKDTTYRGTCINLSIGGKNMVELRH